MKAPEKIYLHLTTGNRLLNGEYCERKPAKIRVDDKIIEYTRTDAFIEKACEWLKEHTFSELNLDFGHSLEIKEFVDIFKNYMKGE